jgi:hypothetical protein
MLFRTVFSLEKRKILTIVAAGLLLFLALGTSRAFSDTWARTYGSPDSEEPISIRQLSDGGVIIAGDISVGDAPQDMWILRSDTTGNMAWARRFDIPYTDLCYDIKDTSDGGFIAGGFSQYYRDIGRPFILKLDGAGNALWQKIVPINYGYASSVLENFDGGYVAAGTSNASAPLRSDFWIVKLDASGNALWQKTFGGPSGEEGKAVIQTQDRGYAFVGFTFSFGAGSSDGWFLKLDAEGNIQWQKAYGGPLQDRFFVIRPAPDGGFYVAGDTASFGMGDRDAWVLRLDSTGNIQWQETFGGLGDDRSEGVALGSDGGCAILCRTNSFGTGENDGWLLKLDSIGAVQWQKRYGGPLNDGTSVALDSGPDGGFILAADTASFGSGMYDAWVLKVDSDGNIQSPCPFVFDTSVQGIDSSALVTETTATAVDLNAEVLDTSFQLVDVQATVLQQCPEAQSSDEDEDEDQDEESDQVQSLIPTIPNASVNRRAPHVSVDPTTTRHRP